RPGILAQVLRQPGQLVASTGPLFSRPDSESPAEPAAQDAGRKQPTSSATQVRAWLDPAIEAVRGVADVQVHDSVEALRQALDRPNIPEDVQGIYIEGGRTVHLVGDQLGTREQAQRKFVHEVFGHLAMERHADMQKAIAMVHRLHELKGRTITGLWNEVARSQPGLTSQAHAKEVIALMAERGVNNSIIDRLITAAKELLRKMGIALEYSDRELRQLIARAARALREEAGGSNAGARPASSSDASASAPLYARDAGEVERETGKAVDQAFAHENRRLREEHDTAWQKAKRAFRRNFAPGGLLPESVFEEKIARDNELQAVEFDVRHLVGDLERAVKADYGVNPANLEAEQARELNEALAGRPSESIPLQSLAAVLAMRQYIDGLSSEYAGILGARLEAKLAADPASDIGTDAALRATILGNLCQYVHRSSRAFDDPKWFKQVPDAVLSAARAYLAKGYLEQGHDAAGARRLAEVTVHEILKNGTAYDSMESFIAEGKLGAKDLSVLMRRQTIAPEIRALLGEYQDPTINFTKTATKMGRLIWNQRFLDRVRDVGLGSFLFEGKERPPEATTQIAAEESEAYAPLNGLWTTPEVAQAFRDVLGKERMGDVYRAIVRMNGLVKYGKTVLSPTTAARNWQSAMFFALANGHFDLTQMRKSIAALREQVLRNATEEQLAYLRKLKRLGVVYDAPYAGEMVRLLEDARVEELLERGGAPLRLVRKANQVAKGFYSFGDDFWKIIGFENEKRSLIGAGLSEEQAEREAAERIRNTYPTYSMVGRGVKALARFPLVGTFVSFPAEILRTSANILRYIH
ncbi:MAG: hypothetical protein ACREXP_16290, partial [Steroidobacteraceae bacterium]